MGSRRTEAPGAHGSRRRAGTPAVAKDERLQLDTAFALAAMALAVLVIAIDTTAPSVALPAIERGFSVDVSEVQWVINAYNLVFGVLIVAGGRLADTLGRRRTFLRGAAIFAVFSLLSGLAPGPGWLIAARGLAGVGAALMWPATLGMTYAALPPRRAGLAGGLILGVAGTGNALGPMIGGALTDAASWRWVFFLNIPVVALACLMTWLKLNQPQVANRHERIDVAGIVTLSAGCFTLLIGLNQAPRLGLGDWRVIGLLLVCVSCIGAFWRHVRRRGAAALIPPDVARSRQFAAACVAIPLMAAGFFASLLYLPQFTQRVLGYSPLQAGLGVLPLMLVYGGVSFLAGPLYNRLGPKPTTATGAGLMTTGLILLSLVTGRSAYSALVPGMVVFGAGLGLFLSSVTTAGVTALDPSRASLGGGTLHMLQLTGGSIGLGLTTAVFTSAFHSTVQKAHAAGELSRAQAHAVNSMLGYASTAHLVRRLPSTTRALDRVSHDAFATALQSGFRVTAALGALGFVVALGFIGGRLGLRAAHSSG